MKHSLKGCIASRRVWLDGKELTPEKSLKKVNHSPDGFCWGYGGSGPAQLAAAILLELTGSIDGYQAVKWEVIARLPKSDFEVELEV